MKEFGPVGGGHMTETFVCRSTTDYTLDYICLVLFQGGEPQSTCHGDYTLDYICLVLFQGGEPQTMCHSDYTLDYYLSCIISGWRAPDDMPW